MTQEKWMQGSIFFLMIRRLVLKNMPQWLTLTRPLSHPILTAVATHFLYSEDYFSKVACMVAPKGIISHPQVWQGQGSRKWKLEQSDGFFVQFESPILRKIWSVPSSVEKGRTLCRSPEPLDTSIHEVLPRIFKETA